MQLITAGLGYRGKYGGASPILGGDARSDDLHLLNCVGGWQFNCLATMRKIHTSAIELHIGRERTISLDVQTLLVAVDVVARTHMLHPWRVIEGFDDVPVADRHFSDQLVVHKVAQCVRPGVDLGGVSRDENAFPGCTKLQR